MDVRFSITIRQHKSLRNLIEAIPEDAWTPIPYWMDGAADVAETTCIPFQSEPDAAPVRLIVRRVKPTPGSQLALFATYSYHGFITDRDGEMLELEADHRRHAEIENAIRACTVWRTISPRAASPPRPGGTGDGPPIYPKSPGPFMDTPFRCAVHRCLGEQEGMTHGKTLTGAIGSVQSVPGMRLDGSPARRAASH